MPIDAELFKDVCRRWTTGVTIVTARADDRIHGMTVSAFCEVSLQPPLVLVCADKQAHTKPLIEEGRVFAVNVLARGQEALSNKFASKQDEWQRFDGLDWETAKTGAPLLPGTVAGLDCRLVATHDAGDHVIFVGEVEWARVDADAAPLLYSGGGYGSFQKA
ncbi:MAG: flavin reductase family protein [Myxococcota bacterium]|nr:flavin reductase family protein [Myxococcota bacterium]